MIWLVILHVLEKKRRRVNEDPREYCFSLLVFSLLDYHDNDRKRTKKDILHFVINICDVKDTSIYCTTKAVLSQFFKSSFLG